MRIRAGQGPCHSDVTPGEVDCSGPGALRGRAVRGITPATEKGRARPAAFAVEADAGSPAWRDGSRLGPGREAGPWPDAGAWPDGARPEPGPHREGGSEREGRRRPATGR